MKKYIKQIKQLPNAIVNDTFTPFQSIVMLSIVLAFIAAGAFCIHYYEITHPYSN